MIFVDTNVLVALVDPRDGLHGQACADIARLVRVALFTVTPVLTEAYFALPAAYQRARLREVIEALPIRPWAMEKVETLWPEVMTWLGKFAAHEPDVADGFLAVLAGRNRQAKIWTYDREFRTVWRRPDGTKIPVA